MEYKLKDEVLKEIAFAYANNKSLDDFPDSPEKTQFLEFIVKTKAEVAAELLAKQRVLTTDEIAAYKSQLDTLSEEDQLELLKEILLCEITLELKAMLRDYETPLRKLRKQNKI